MTSGYKQIAAGVGAVAMALTFMGAASAAQAQNRYDGFCYEKVQNTKTKGTVIGAAAGAALGNVAASDGRKTEGTILGGVVGAVVGNQIGEHQKEKNKAECLNNRYYVYDGGRYYTPPRAPEGYRVAYYNERPYYDSYYTHKNGKVRQYKPKRNYR
ncbi:MAG: glycine zipper domain-containing protein [Asticcacaulis sp.]|uniref:glycine zipper domain-containing protein n=1 Tax=Asticcacaulis tiandongensis TaxID=2565365 RepID=UPI0011292450|nr:glycine zipper domain-containing protein [Asticcacaulis tiandongensis]